MTMSIAMANGLNALIGINKEMSDLQTQATTGKKVNGPADGLAAYLSSVGYSQRSERLQNVNDTLSNNLQTIKAAKTGLDSIRKTITDALDTLKAASQTQSFVAAAGQTDNPTGNSAGGTQIGFNFGAMLNGGAQQLNNAVLGAGTALVNPPQAGAGGIGVAGAAITINGQKLVQGQVFKVNNTSIRIAAAGDAAIGDGSGSSLANAKNVFTIGDFLGAVKEALGVNGQFVNPPAAGANLNAFFAGANAGKIIVALNNQAQGANNTITFKQEDGADVALNLLFAGARAKPAVPGATYDSDDQTAVVNKQFTMNGNARAITGGTAGQAADARRASAAKSYKLAIDQVNQYLRNASVSGTNLLAGDILKVTFDEKGTSTTFQVQDAANNALKFDAASLGLVNAATGLSPDLALNFATNEDAALDAQGNSTLGLNAAINKLTNSLGVLSSGDAQVAQFQATVSNRVDFNKTIIGLLNDAGNALTAADMTQVSAQYAALQVQQSFAQTIMANTKQNDQSILQLLR